MSFPYDKIGKKLILESSFFAINSMLGSQCGCQVRFGITLRNFPKHKAPCVYFVEIQEIP